VTLLEQLFRTSRDSPRSNLKLSDFSFRDLLVEHRRYTSDVGSPDSANGCETMYTAAKTSTSQAFITHCP